MRPRPSTLPRVLSRMPIEIRCERFPVLSETFVVNEALALARMGHPVHVYAHERGDSAGSAPAGIPTRYREDETTGSRLVAVLRLALRHPLGVLSDLAARPRWRREEQVPPLRVLAPALVKRSEAWAHVHFAAGAALDAVRAKRITGAPFSLTAHAYEIYAHRANLPEKLRSAAVVTTGCSYTAHDLCAAAPEARVEVVVMGVDTDRFRRTAPVPERRVVLAVGRLVEKKGFAVLLDAVARPELRGCIDELRIAGAGPLEQSLRAQAHELGIDDTVRFLGALDPAAVRGELEQAAVLATPCIIAADGDRDSMPVVAKEALSMEVPVVCSDTAGLPELVHAEFGRVVPAGDPASLARALAELLAMPPEARQAMGALGRAHVAEHASLRTETARLATLLLEARDAA